MMMMYVYSGESKTGMLYSLGLVVNLCMKQLIFSMLWERVGSVGTDYKNSKYKVIYLSYFKYLISIVSF
jgi:hypothetical protein